MSYDETMDEGSRQYADILAALAEAGLAASFIQTGGMCAAIEIRLETGHTVLVTDADDTLAWTRAEHLGWGVGLYAPGEDIEEALRYEQTDASDQAGLLALISRVLGQRTG
jgi:hypothetical protein